jgi:hypothetical protein
MLCVVLYNYMLCLVNSSNPCKSYHIFILLGEVLKENSLQLLLNKQQPCCSELWFIFVMRTLVAEWVACSSSRICLRRSASDWVCPILQNLRTLEIITFTQAQMPTNVPLCLFRLSLATHNPRPISSGCNTSRSDYLIIIILTIKTYTWSCIWEELGSVYICQNPWLYNTKWTLVQTMDWVIMMCPCRSKWERLGYVGRGVI